MMNRRIVISPLEQFIEVVGGEEQSRLTWQEMFWFLLNI